MDEGQKCFRSGDVRVNEHPGLVRATFTSPRLIPVYDFTPIILPLVHQIVTVAGRL
jgi:hypothetical protein